LKSYAVYVKYSHALDYRLARIIEVDPKTSNIEEEVKKQAANHWSKIFYHEVKVIKK